MGIERDSAVVLFRIQAVNRPNMLCSANKGWNVTNKASIYPIMLSNHQLSSQGPGERGTNQHNAICSGPVEGHIIL